MILNLSKSKTIKPELWGNEKAEKPFSVTFKVLTPPDFESLKAEGKFLDSEVFGRFVEKIDGLEVNLDGEKIQLTTAEDVLKYGHGLTRLVSTVAKEIITAGVFTIESKNLPQPSTP
ncbi:MAG TPA: hypothetical protein DCP98_08480 [Sphaerochaeta sp.]|nr:hypothetical protein [Sphaerochaeta sp.]